MSSIFEAKLNKLRLSSKEMDKELLKKQINTLKLSLINEYWNEHKGDSTKELQKPFLELYSILLFGLDTRNKELDLSVYVNKNIVFGFERIKDLLSNLLALCDFENQVFGSVS